MATEIEFETGLNKPAPWLLVKSEEAPDGKFRVLGDPSTCAVARVVRQLTW